MSLTTKSASVPVVETKSDAWSGMSSAIARKVVSYFQTESRKLDELTPKENELLALLAEGLFYKEIADKMHISMDTVKKHASTIYRKLQVSNRTEAVNRYKS